jgi:hypothetical protein
MPFENYCDGTVRVPLPEIGKDRDVKNHYSHQYLICKENKESFGEYCSLNVMGTSLRRTLLI